MAANRQFVRRHSPRTVCVKTWNTFFIIDFIFAIDLYIYIYIHTYVHVHTRVTNTSGRRTNIFCSVRYSRLIRWLRGENKSRDDATAARFSWSDLIPTLCLARFAQVSICTAYTLRCLYQIRYCVLLQASTNTLLAKYRGLPLIELLMRSHSGI